MRLRFVWATVVGILISGFGTIGLANAALQELNVVRLLYFYSADCLHCQAVQKDVLTPLQERYRSRLDVQMLEIGAPANYELLVRTEEFFAVRPLERGIPTLVVGDHILIGEDEIRQQLPGLIERGTAQGGMALPKIEGLDAALGAKPTDAPGELPICGQATQSNCVSAAPVWMAYFYQVGCQKCSRAEADIQYVRGRYPQLIVDQFNIYDNAALAQWLAERTGRTEIHTPMLFIGGDALVGDEEISPQRLEALVNRYASSGAERVWANFNAPAGLIERFRALGALTVVFAGLVDGLNPCAFATLIFLISYLTFSGRQGRAVVVVGAAFTLGVFLAYLGVGLGLYKILDLLGGLLTALSRWVYVLTALLCAVLAAVSFFDFVKARRGQIQDMHLRLPRALRRRINAVVRTGQQTHAYVVGAFVTGAVVSFIELACTGQIYLPTIIFVTSIPELRVQALTYLVLYNLLFILPLVVVFVLAYFGTTSHQLGRFLERNTATVKLGAVLLFASLAVWLGLSLVA